MVRTRDLVAKEGGGANYAINFAGLVALCCADYCKARYLYHYAQIAQDKRKQRQRVTEAQERAASPTSGIVPAVPLPAQAPPSPLPDAVLIHLAGLLPPLATFLHTRGAQPQGYSARLTHAPAGEPAVQVPAARFVEEADALWGALHGSSALCSISRDQIFFRTAQRAVEAPPGTLRSQQQVAVGHSIALARSASGVAEAFQHPGAPKFSLKSKSKCADCGSGHQTGFKNCKAKRH